MKRLAAKTGEYIKDNQTKGEYTKIGVLMPGQDGEYLLLDPTVSLAGVLAKQNVLATLQGKPLRDSVMVSVFVEDNQQQNNQNQGQQQNNQQQGQQNYQDNQQPNQGGYQRR